MKRVIADILEKGKIVLDGNMQLRRIVIVSEEMKPSTRNTADANPNHYIK